MSSVETAMAAEVLHDAAPLERRQTVPQLLLIGVDHRTASIELREKVSYDEADAKALLRGLVADEAVAEASLLSTCNRTELYLLPTDDALAYRLGLERCLLCRAPEIEAEGRFFVLRDSAAAEHLFEVSSGLQSMVLGEPEILGQVKRAAAWADEVGTAGSVLGRLHRSAISAGGRARGETGISAGAVSFGYAVIDLARNIFSQLEDLNVLVVGAGETARLVARNLGEKGARKLLVTNRGQTRLDEFCELFPEAEPIPFDRRHEGLGRSDVVVVTTGADQPVLLRSHFEQAMLDRRSRPLLVADLGVPRNVEPAAGKLENLFLQTVDSLEGLIQYNLKRRRDEIPRVQNILERELGRYTRWYRSREAEPVIAQLQRWAEAVRRRELESARERFPEATHDQLDRLTRSLVKKILHHPSLHLRNGANPGHLDLVRDLFQLDSED